MNSGGHAGFGILFFLITAKILGYPITGTGILLAILFSLLPDVDVVLSYFLNIKHREITHSTPIAITLVLATAFYSIPLSMALLSHYLADYIYPSLLRKVVPVAPENPVSEEEFYSAAVIGFSSLYSLILITVNTEWFSQASAITLFLITIIEVFEKIKKK